MSQTAAAGGDDAQTQTVEKDVTIIGYGQDPTMDERAFADAVGDRDYYERKTTVTTNHYIKYTTDDGDERTHWLPEAVYNALLGAEDERSPESNATIVEETEEKVGYEQSPNNLSRELLNDVLEDVPAELSHGIETGIWSSKWQDGENVTKVRFEREGVETLRVFTHQSERDGERFESDEEYPAVKFRFHYEGTEEEVADWSEETVGPAMTALAAVDGIGRVRLTDCKTRVEREGDCYEAL